MSALVQTEVLSNGVAWIRFSSPETLNAMTEAMGQAFLSSVAELDRHDDVRVIVVSGHGRAFSAGGDLKMLNQNGALIAEDIKEKMLAFYSRFLSIRTISKPTIAALNGHAIGAGLCIALACDMRIASSTAKMGVNFTRLGLSPGMGATYLLSRTVGVANAMDLLLTGRIFPAEEALQLGVVNRIVAPEDFEAATVEWASQVAAAGPIANRLTKQMIYSGMQGSLEDALEREAGSQSITFPSHDFGEGLSAALEKRDPDFKNC